MAIDIFFRTYKRDFELIKYSIYSIFKYVTSFRNVIITVRTKEYYDFLNTIKHESFYLDNVDKIKIFPVYNFQDNIDYFGQQVSKLNADMFTDAEYILFVDSDCIFYDNFDIKSMFDTDNKIILLIETFENLPDGYSVWKKCLELCEFTTEYEFMRRLPLLYPSNLLKNLKNYIVQKYNTSFENACLQIYNLSEKYFSEFNLLGAYGYLHDPQYFNFTKQSESTEIPLKQIQNYDYSYDVNEQLNEMKKILNL